MTDAGEGNEIGRGALRACLGGFAVPEGAEEHTPPAGAPVRCGPPRRAGRGTGRRGCAARDALRARLRQALCRGCRRARRRHHLRGRAGLRRRGPRGGPGRGRAHGGLPRGRLQPAVPGGECGALPAHRGGRRRGGLRARMGLPAPAPHLPRPQPAHCGALPGHAHRGGGAALGHVLHGRRGAARGPGGMGGAGGHHLCGVEGGRTACCTRGRSPLWTTKPSPTRSSQPSVV